jgi:5'-nucleotidase
MKILVSNDDGYNAPGIICLAQALTQMENITQVTVVAPDRNRSGASNSLTLETPLRIKQQPNGYISINGTPTDCVHVALTGLLEDTPDIVISGINEGANLGDDVLYSGTVAAAMEGRFLGLPAIAVSLAGAHPVRHYDTAARVLLCLLQRLKAEALPVNTILNVNVPDVPWEELQGVHATRLGHRHKAEAVIKQRDPRGETIYWLGPPGKARDDGPDTDFYAIAHKQVSVTPLHVDLTRHSALETTANWLKTP